MAGDPGHGGSVASATAGRAAALAVDGSTGDLLVLPLEHMESATESPDSAAKATVSLGDRTTGHRATGMPVQPDYHCGRRAGERSRDLRAIQAGLWLLLLLNHLYYAAAWLDQLERDPQDVVHELQSVCRG